MTPRTDGPDEPAEPVAPVWVSAFLDVAALAWPAASRYWSRLTGWPLSPARGEHDEFATLVPPDGDDYLRVQRLGAGPSRIHLDLHGAHLAALYDRALELGASAVADQTHDGYQVLASPGGLVFCLVTHPGRVVPPATSWSGGHRSRLAQVCIDAAATDFEAEVAFWAALTGRAVQSFDVSDDFVALTRPPGQPLRLILQRLGTDDPGRPARAHLEWWTGDLAAEVERHLTLGARSGPSDDPSWGGPYWAVLRDPADLPYCVVTRDPETGHDHRLAGESVTNPHRID